MPDHPHGFRLHELRPVRIELLAELRYALVVHAANDTPLRRERNGLRTRDHR